MATNTLCSGSLRTLPALLLALRALFSTLLRTLFVTPQPEIPQPSKADAAPAVADRTTVLTAQFTAGVRGSRAPPVAAA